MQNEIQVVTYHSENAKPQERWIAYVVINGEQWLVRFCGEDEATAADRARNFYKAEQQRQKILMGEGAAAPIIKQASIIVSGVNVPNKKPEAWGGWQQGTKALEATKEHKLSGSVWVANVQTKHKTRIAASELAAYEANGYIKAGPRTKI